MGGREIKWRFLNLGLLTMAYNCQDGNDYANDGLRMNGVCKEEETGFPAWKKKLKPHFFCDSPQSGSGVEFKGQLPSFGPPT